MIKKIKPKRVKLLYLFVLLFVFSISANGQITIRKEVVTEKSVPKPPKYDSLQRFTFNTKPLEYKKYIGQDIFFIPYSDKYVEKDKQGREKRKDISFLTTKEIKEVTRGNVPVYPPIEETLYFKDYCQGLKSDLKKNSLCYKFYQRRVNNYLDKANERFKTSKYAPIFSHPIKVVMREHKESSKQFFDFFKIDNTITTDKNKVEGKYFTIINVEYGNSTEVYFDKITDEPTYSYKELADVDFSMDEAVLKVTLLNKKTKDTLFWKCHLSSLKQSEWKYKSEIRFGGLHPLPRPYPFVLVSFFNKHKELYEGKRIIIYEDLEPLVDINTGEKVKLMQGEILNCTEVSFIELESHRLLEPFYIVKNEKGNTLKLPLGSSNNNTFILLSEHKRREILVNMLQAERERLEKEAELKRQKEFEALQKKYIAKFGKEKGTLIAKGKVTKGMTKEMCRLAWGEPIQITVLGDAEQFKPFTLFQPL